ncbi:MAG: ATP-binding protein [Porphyromonas sp.]|nr:ATP-binding protein [Porphyromonas sp.]
MFDFWMILSALLAVTLVAVVLLNYRKSVRPLRTIANGLNLLKAQDFSSRLKKIGQKDADEVVDLFNRLMQQLKEERLKLREQNEFLDLLVKASPMGVVVLDYDRRIVSINPSAKEILGIGEETYGQIVTSITTRSAIDLSKVPPQSTETFNCANGAIYKVTHASFIDRGFKRSFYQIEHLTEEVRKAERKAYEKVIRLMAHEVNNSVAGITSILDTATEALQEEEPDLAEALSVCLDRSYRMSQFVSRFANVIKVPKINPQPTDLNQLITNQHTLLENLSGDREITFIYRLDPSLPKLMIDGPLMEQVLINIVKNAAESIEGQGEITIRTSWDEQLLEVIDNGTEIPEGVAVKLFSPFFTTKPNGQGIGLLLIQEVLSQHRYSYRLQTDPVTHLTHFTIHLRK